MSATSCEWKVLPHGRRSEIGRVLTALDSVRMPLGERRVRVE